jgi:iron(III) transport system ATP-binding protein
MFFLLGPSGCGKTTLLRILAGLEQPDSGTIRIAGRDVAALPPHERGCPMVFQNYALWPHLSVTENVAFGLVERRVPRAETQERVRSALGRVGLDGLGARMPGQLSGGQQQRVVLARALVLDPPVVLLDEPLSNLDAKLRLEMREEIERLHSETDVTFVYVTHDQAEALSLADRMAVMNAGRLRALGTPQDLYHRPPNLFCADFLGEANAIDGRVTAARGSALEVETPLGTWLASPPAGGALDRGAAVRCIIRPENVHPAAGDGNRFEAAVERLRMNGSTTTVFLRAGGTPIKATILSQAAVGLVPGATGTWCAPVADTLAFAAAPEGAPA